MIPRRLLLIAALAGLAFAGLSAARPDAPAKPIYQLRAYQLFEPSKAAFHARFRDHALRIMRRHGFDVIAIWNATRKGNPEFVYLLRWRDESSMKAAWKAFMADDEWIAIKRATVSPDAPIVGDIEDRTMVLADYSPEFR